MKDIELAECTFRPEISQASRLLARRYNRTKPTHHCSDVGAGATDEAFTKRMSRT
jgi:hypothetical protein